MAPLQDLSPRPLSKTPLQDLSPGRLFRISLQYSYPYLFFSFSHNTPCILLLYLAVLIKRKIFFVNQ